MSIENNETYRRVRERVPTTHPKIVYGEFRLFATKTVSKAHARQAIVTAYKTAQEELRKLGYDIHDESKDLVYVENF